MLRNRRSECAKLDGMLHAARSGRSGVLVVLGEAGIGKYYAHFTVASERVASTELDQLASHNGMGQIRLLRQGVPMVARLGGTSRVRQGQVAELWFDTTQLKLFDDSSGRILLTTGTTT